MGLWLRAEAPGVHLTQGSFPFQICTTKNQARERTPRAPGRNKRNGLSNEEPQTENSTSPRGQPGGERDEKGAHVAKEPHMRANPSTKTPDDQHAPPGGQENHPSCWPSAPHEFGPPPLAGGQQTRNNRTEEKKMELAAAARHSFVAQRRDATGPHKEKRHKNGKENKRGCMRHPCRSLTKFFFNPPHAPRLSNLLDEKKRKSRQRHRQKKTPLKPERQFTLSFSRIREPHHSSFEY